MTQRPIYMDGHATTPVDPRVAEVVLRMMTEEFGNAASEQHAYGNAAKEVVESSRATVADALNVSPREIVFTSGATESNNLAIRGLLERDQSSRRQIVALTTEHKAVLDPLSRAARQGFDVKYVGVRQADEQFAGLVDLNELEAAVCDETLLVCVMLANNEIGAIQQLTEVAELCHRHGALLFCDAVQALGKIPVDLGKLGVDLASFSAHKMYGPKGAGALYIRRSVQLAAQIDGGGHERGLRSGTLNVPGIAGFAEAVKICQEEMPDEANGLQVLRDQLYEKIRGQLDGVFLNGPSLDARSADQSLARLPHNLNCSFAGVDGDALMAAIQPLAVSSGSACTTSDPRPSHVVSALGRNEQLTRASLRFGLGRFNTSEEVEQAAELVTSAVKRLRKLTTK